jgi:hypothetical protein
MYLDNLARLTGASGQALASAAAIASTDFMDLINGRDIGIGEPLALVVNILVTAGGTTPTLICAVQVDDNTSFSSATTIVVSRTFVEADLVAGNQIVVPIPPFSWVATSNPSSSEYRYLRGLFTAGGTSPTVTISADIKPMSMIQNYRAYADAVTIQ